MTTGAQGGWATLGGRLCSGTHWLACPPGLGPQDDQGLALKWGAWVGGGATSAVLAPVMAAATEKEVGCLWSWAKVLPGEWGSCQLFSPHTVSMPGRNGVAGL